MAGPGPAGWHRPAAAAAGRPRRACQLAHLGHARHDHGPLWRSFLTEQRALVRELGALTASLGGLAQPALLLADPHDTVIPVSTTHRLAALLPAARVQLVNRIGHHLPRRATPQIAAALVQFLAALDQRSAPA